MKKWYLHIAILALLTSCSEYFTIKKTDTTDAVAKVHNTYLYKKDIEKVLPKNIASEDSTVFVKNYINTWAKHQLLLYKAEMNLEENKQSFDDLVKKYRDDLFINSYKQALISQELNTNVSQNDIKNYYEANKENFKLKESLVKFRYVHFDKKIIGKTKLTRLFKSSKEDDLEELKTRELEFKSFHFNDSIWVKYEDMLKQISPLVNVNKKDLLKKDAYVRKTDSVSEYLVKIKAVLKPNDVAPISYIAPTIEELIIHQRKLELIRNIEKTLMQDAISSKQFEQY